MYAYSFAVLRQRNKRREQHTKPRFNLSQQLILPLVLSETCQHEFVTDDKRALHEHTVRRKQPEQLDLAHIGQLLCQLRLTVLSAACIEESFQRKSAHLVVFS